jgi:hypothetical protein
MILKTKPMRKQEKLPAGGQKQDGKQEEMI